MPSNTVPSGATPWTGAGAAVTRAPARRCAVAASLEATGRAGELESAAPTDETRTLEPSMPTLTAQTSGRRLRRPALGPSALDRG